MSNKTLGLIGIVLIVVGALALVAGGIPYRNEETVVNMGPVTVQADTQREISLPPIVGVLAMGGGIVLLVVSRKSS